MNPDTAPIQEIEAFLLSRVPESGPATYHFHPVDNGPITRHIRDTMDAAIACLPPGWKWKCTAHNWSAWGPNWNTGTIEHPRSGHVVLARDELLRLAAKACQAEEYR